jgi:titin
VSATPAVVVVPPQVPGAPQSLVAAGISPKGVSLTWAAPASDGGSPITRYTVLRSRNAGRESTYATVTCTAGTCAFRDTSTVKTATYYYQVAAVNVVGTGPRSNEASSRASR